MEKYGTKNKKGCEDRMAQNISKRVAQQIVETVKDVCNHNINFIDTKGIIFASTDSARVGNYHEIGRQVAVTGHTIEVERDTDYYGTHKGVNIPFIYKGELIAVIGISGEPAKVRQYAYLAQKITSLILREHEIEVKSSNRRDQMNYVVRALTTGEHINHDYLMEFLDSCQVDIQKTYQTVVVELASRYHPSNLSMIEQRIYDVFENVGAQLIAFQYPNEYVMILEEKQLQKTMNMLKKLAREHLGLLKIGIGISTQITRQDKSYQAAKIALHSLMADQNIALFDELNLEILLGSIAPEVKKHFLGRTIEKLDEKEQHLLEVYFDSDFSLKATCEKLFIHKNTVQYQLDRIKKICGYDPRSFRDAVILYLGLRLR